MTFVSWHVAYWFWKMQKILVFSLASGEIPYRFADVTCVARGAFAFVNKIWCVIDIVFKFIKELDVYAIEDGTSVHQRLTMFTKTSPFQSFTPLLGMIQHVKYLQA